MKIINERLYDMHTHTYFAYCADSDMKPEAVYEEARKQGVEGLAITEHAGQLYVSADDFWSAHFIENPDLIRDRRRNRMEEYKKAVLPLRSKTIKVGLEVDLDRDGNMTLLEQDKTGWDVIIGAIHWIPSEFQNDLIKGYLWSLDAFSRHNIDILAHPFRIFCRKGISTPKELYTPAVAFLKDNNVAAELNFHTNVPDPAFFKMCIQEGVKISLGSDAHSLCKAGRLAGHLEFLLNLCQGVDIENILYT